MRFKDIKMLDQGKPHITGKQAIIDFGKYKLSIICNDMSYGGKSGMYEVGVFKDWGTDKEQMCELPGITTEGDTVAGYLTASNLDAILNKMYLITAEEPTQI
jgi:hypothetical protein